MLRIFKEWRARRDWEDGRRLALEVDRLRTSERWSDDEVAQHLARSRLASVREFRHPFSNGYEVGWQEIGRRDAQHGSCRARRLKNHWYNMGWWNEIVERRRWGWKHCNLDESFELMKNLYWDKIASGKSDGYYKD